MPRPKLSEPRYRLRRRKNGVFTLSWTDLDSGKTKAVSTGQTDPRQAEIWRDQFVAGLDQPEPPEEPLISDILDGYLAARKSKVAAYERLEFAAAVLKRHVGNLAPNMLTPAMYLARRARDGVADGTVRREAGVLRAALNWAAGEQPPWIGRVPRVELPPMPPPRERWLSLAELKALISAAAPHVRLFVILAYHTAARAGAILDLTWDRVDLEHGRISYERPGRRRTNKRRATVPINPVLLAELRTARRVLVQELPPEESARRRELGLPAVPINVVEWHGRPLKSIKKGFGEACRRAGVDDCSPHVIRHTAATHMAMKGVPLQQIAHFLGDSLAVVERVYAKFSPDYLADAADALADGFGPRLVSTSQEG